MRVNFLHPLRSSFTQKRSISVYVHWPYCAAICPYCDFNKYIVPQVDEDRMKRALLTELKSGLEEMSDKDEPLVSIFFGGGTPSLASPDTIAAIIDWLKTNRVTTSELEITLESNPTSTELQKLKLFRDAGVNRISLGIQSMMDEDLKYLGRKHTSTDSLRAIEAAMSLYDRVSIDLIYARHQQQSENDWRAELKSALALNVKHISLYTLTIESGTPFDQAVKTNKIFLPDEDVISNMFDICYEECEKFGLQQYEVSNYCQPGHESLHNANYWQNGDFLGIGPGAASRMSVLQPVDGATDSDQRRRRKIALSAIRHPNKWMEAVEQCGMGLAERETLSLESQIMESVLFGLRTRSGISRESFLRTSDGKDFEEVLNMEQVSEYVFSGLLLLDNQKLQATRAGLKILDTITKNIIS